MAKFQNKRDVSSGSTNWYGQTKHQADLNGRQISLYCPLPIGLESQEF